jgi:branched-chain amino acid transport system permease protein
VAPDRIVREVAHMNKRSAAAFLAVAVALSFVPNLRSAVGFPVYDLVFMYSVFYWITQATSWNILSGYSGYFSFGQAAFVGTGLYTTAILTITFKLNFFLTIPIAGLVSTLLALILGFVAFRLRALRGEVFTLLTLIVALALAAVAQLSDFVDGGQGRTIPVPTYPDFFGSYTDLIFRMGVVMAVGSVAVAYAIQYSRFGRGLFAIRDDEDVAEALGTPSFRYKMVAFAISGFIAGAAGGVNSLQLSYVTIDGTFTFITPLFVILMSTLGGRNHWLGPVLGAAMIFLLQERLAGSAFSSYNQILLGAVLALTILFIPEGLFLRLRTRWRPSVAIFIAAMAVQTATGLFNAVLSQILVALVLVLPVLTVPARYLRWAPWLHVEPVQRPAPGGFDAGEDHPAEPKAVNLGH